MSHLPRSDRRPGSTLVEGTIILFVFVTLILGMLDLGIALFRQNILTAAARQGARQAIVHGSLAPAGEAWGPDPVGPTPASTSAPAVDAIRPFLVGLDPTAVTLEVLWLDGSNERDSRVRVTVTTLYHPTIPWLLGSSPRTLQATSTMIIMH